MATKKKAKKKAGRRLEAFKPTKGESKFKRKPKVDHIPRGATGQYETILTDELCDQLIEVHKEGDILPATALCCGVHPVLLKKWLEQGSAYDAVDPFRRLFATFAVVEGEIRRDCLKDARSPYTKNVNGITWYMERRFSEWRPDAKPREHEVFAVVDLLLPAKGAMDQASALYIFAQVLQNIAALPPALQELFQQHRIVQLPEGKTPDAPPQRSEPREHREPIRDDSGDGGDDDDEGYGGDESVGEEETDD